MNENNEKAQAHANMAAHYETEAARLHLKANDARSAAADHRQRAHEAGRDGTAEGRLRAIEHTREAMRLRALEASCRELSSANSQLAEHHRAKIDPPAPAPTSRPIIARRG